MERRPTLSLNEWAVLGLLVERSRHGYDIAAELRPSTPLGVIWRLDRPLVYRALERLEALGLAESRRQEQSATGPQRTIYGATRRGRSELREWLMMPVDHLRDIRSALLLKLALIQRLAIDPTPLIEAQRGALAPRFEQLASPPDDPTDLAGLWRHHSANAAAAFLDALERRSTFASAR